jgi:hypothetical protein
LLHDGIAAIGRHSYCRNLLSKPKKKKAKNHKKSEAEP